MKEKERLAMEVDCQTQTSSPGGTNDDRGGGGWGNKLSALLHVHRRDSRVSSRKSSRASSEASDISELGNASAWLFPNIPLLLLSGATGTHEDLPLSGSVTSNLAKASTALQSQGTVRYCTYTYNLLSIYQVHTFAL